jgi:hypothetical protein
MGFADQALEILGDIGNNGTNLRLLESCIGQIVPFVGAGLSADFGYPMWDEFLKEMAIKAGAEPEVSARLAEHKFEEAAETVISSSPANEFDDNLQDKFDDRRLPRPLRSGAARYLPRIAFGPVLTTNFDRVLETAFEDAGRRFKEVFPGTRIHAANRALQLNQRTLLKLHGDYADKASRVLTLTEYAREYGSPDAAGVKP